MAWANVRNRWAVTQRLERREKPRGQARLLPSTSFTREPCLALILVLTR